MMDAIGDRRIKTVVAMTSSQIGKTEIICNTIGYHIHHDPAPILVLQPTLEMAEVFSKDRLAPMLRDTPALAGAVQNPRSRDSGNTTLQKIFPGGRISMAGANSAASLASRPIRILLCDEVDRYPISAGSEGDPVSLARRRTATFWNRKIILTSTPTIKRISRIEAEWLASDQRRYFVPCPHCAEMQHLEWSGVRWPEGRPRAARYHCRACGAEWTENERRAAIRWGEWRATAPGNGEIAGFHLNEIYSPWVSLGDMAGSFLDARARPALMQTWVNTALGETYEEDAERVDHHALSARAEAWGDTAPLGVLIVTCGVDVQEARIEIERVGWGAEEESWSLDHRIIYGDPAGPEIWAALDDYLAQPTTRADGEEISVDAVSVDSGYQTQAVYRFCKPLRARKVFAVKGVPGKGKPIWIASKSTQARGKIFLVGTDTAKDAIYMRLRIEQAGPGFCHFPTGREPAFFEQLTSEVVHTRYVRGFPTRVYVLPPGRRNEALDLRVYAYAALQMLNVRWGWAVAHRGAKAERATPATTAGPVAARPQPVAPQPQPKMPAPARFVPQARPGRRVRRSPYMG